MRKTILITVFTLISSMLFSQSFDDKSISQLTQLKAKAVTAEKYDLAAKYKKAIELKKELKLALKEENYQQAADIKNELKSLNGNAPIQSNKTSSVYTNKVQSGSSKGMTTEYVNVIYLHNYNTNENVKLELQEAKVSIETYSAFVVAGSSTFWKVEGYHSSVQLSNKDKFTFLVKTSEGIDPASIFTLSKLNLMGKEKLNRVEIQSKVTAAAFAGANTKNNFETKVPISFKKLGGEMYEIIIDQMLLPGEYAFKFGTKWYLFGAQNRVSNNPAFPVIETNISKIDIYYLSSNDPNMAWLGIDCSLYRIKSDINIGKDKPIKQTLLQGLTYNRKKYINHGKLESWMRKEHRINYQVAFGYDLSENNMPEQWIIPSSQSYSLSKQEIKDHIKKYKINGSGIGFVEIPELTDMEEHKHYGWVVFFDFGTREVLFMKKYIVKQALNKDPREGHFAKEFLFIMKRFIDSSYLKNL